MSAMTLKIIACISMLLDHIGLVFDISILRIIGRLAFPLYLFLLYNGYKHTSNKLLYAVRLAVFAVISQVPFSLFTTGNVFSLNGNVFVTLFISLILIWITDSMIKHRVAKWASFIPTAVLYSAYHFGFIVSDYGAKAVLMSFVFVAIYGDGKGMLRKLLTALGILCAVFNSYIVKWLLLPAYWLIGQNPGWPTISYWQTVQIFSLLALPIIFLYNGKKGKFPIGNLKAKTVQYGFYLFYPVHMIALWAIMVVMNYLM